MSRPRNFRTIRRKITQAMLDNALRIDVYAAKYNYSINGINDRIATRKVVAFKWGGHIYCVDSLSHLNAKS